MWRGRFENPEAAELPRPSTPEKERLRRGPPGSPQWGFCGFRGLVLGVLKNDFSFLVPVIPKKARGLSSVQWCFFHDVGVWGLGVWGFWGLGFGISQSRLWGG